MTILSQPFLTLFGILGLASVDSPWMIFSISPVALLFSASRHRLPQSKPRAMKSNNLYTAPKTLYFEYRIASRRNFVTNSDQARVR